MNYHSGLNRLEKRKRILLCCLNCDQVSDLGIEPRFSDSFVLDHVRSLQQETDRLKDQLSKVEKERKEAHDKLSTLERVSFLFE